MGTVMTTCRRRERARAVKVCAIAVCLILGVAGVKRFNRDRRQP
ncbi:hypothetical protein LCGC14_2712040, partial [marine sediment metagenome]